MHEMTLPALRAEFGRVAANSNLVPLRTISMVGAYPGEEGLPDAQDGFRLAKTLRLLRHCHIPLHPEFEVDVVNIPPAHGGRDFLKETKPADVIVLCFLFTPPFSPGALYGGAAACRHPRHQQAPSERNGVAR